MNLYSLEITIALKNAQNGKQVYDGLKTVPSEQLKHMQEMITHILESREKDALKNIVTFK
jgi:hypothetical protein